MPPQGSKVGSCSGSFPSSWGDDLYVYQLQLVSSSADWWTQLHPAEATGPKSAERTSSFSRKGISPLVEFLQAAAHFKQVLPGYSFCQTTAVEVKVEGFDKLILQLLLFYSMDEKTKRKKQMLCKKFFFFLFFSACHFYGFFSQSFPVPKLAGGHGPNGRSHRRSLTLLKFNSSPLKLYLSKRIKGNLFQPWFCGSYVKLRGCTCKRKKHFKKKAVQRRCFEDWGFPLPKKWCKASQVFGSQKPLRGSSVHAVDCTPLKVV